MTTTLDKPEPAPDAPAGEGRSARSLVDAVFRAREIAIGGALALLILGTWLANPGFLDDQGVKDLLLNSSILVLLAVGQSVVVMTRNIDLSISSTVAVLPGAVGAQTGLASVVLRGVASQEVITAYTVGQALLTTALNVAFGLGALAHQIGWAETRKLVHRRHKEDEAAAVDDAGATPARE